MDGQNSVCRLATCGTSLASCLLEGFPLPAPTQVQQLPSLEQGVDEAKNYVFSVAAPTGVSSLY